MILFRIHSLRLVFYVRCSREKAVITRAQLATFYEQPREMVGGIENETKRPVRAASLISLRDEQQ